MMQFDRISLGRRAKELGFVRDTLEKVCRLVDVLTFFENDDLLSKTLALKGGTAINLTILDFPRLSVDIDLDYCGDIDRDKMLADRHIITDKISKYMTANGYTLSSKSKNYHALDSFVYEYQNCGGVKDNLKIEINYMLRCHVFPPERRKVNLPWNNDSITVLSVSPTEIYASKTVALLTRTAPRDLYDIYNLIKFNKLDSAEMENYKKCVVFYFAIGAEEPPKKFDTYNVGNVSSQQIKRDLNPVLRHGEHFSLEVAKDTVKIFLDEILVATSNEINFWKEFSEGNYKPEMIFNDTEISRIAEHPMALWKCRNKI